MVGIILVGSKLKGQKREKREKNGEQADIHNVVSEVGSTRNRVRIEAQLAGKSEGAREFIEKAGRVSDRLGKRRDKILNLAGAAAAVYIAMLPAAFAGQNVSESGYVQQETTVLEKFIKTDTKYSAKGEEVTRGRATDQIVGIVNINRLKGNSSETINGGRTVNGASVQLNTYVSIIGNNGKERLWVQNGVQVFIHGNRKSEKPSYTYGSISEIFKNSFKADVQAIEGKPVSQQELNGLRLNGIAGRGKTALSMGAEPTYIYPDYTPAKKNGKWTIGGGDTKTSDSLRFALDIKVKERQDIVYLNFGIAPLKNNKPEFNKEVNFDTVSYKVPGLKSAKIEFGKIYDTGLIIAGIGGGSYFHAKEVKGFLSIEERKGRNLVPLKVGGNFDWSTAESTIGVLSIKLNSHTVEIVTAKSGKTASGK